MNTTYSCVVWNVRGLNDRARRNTVRTLLDVHKPAVLCLQETKLSSFCNPVANELLGPSLDYDFLPSVGTAGGVLLAWDCRIWEASDVTKGSFYISAKLSETVVSNAWWITVVYGPLTDADRVQFIAELETFWNNAQGPWLLCGDFNMIYRAIDKNNDRLDRRSMRRFRVFLNRTQLEEIELIGRLYTWSSHRERPTLEHLDRVFASADWLAANSNHVLSPLSTDCSDHCLILLRCFAAPSAKKRFKLEPYWVTIPGYDETVASAWANAPAHGDPFRVIDIKLRCVAKALRSWSNSKIGSIRLQLAMVREVILALEAQMDSRQLLPWEAELRTRLKVQVLGLASLVRTIARQRSRILFLRDGDANTKFYHLQACHRGRKHRIEQLNVEGNVIVSETGMADALFAHFNAVLGTDFERSRRLDFAALGVPTVDLHGLESVFTEEEVHAVITAMPDDKAPGPDGFTGLFYKKSWNVIKADFMQAVHAFWAEDPRSFFHLNDAYLILLKKKLSPTEIRDYRPISLIHSFGKIITKCMAARLAPLLGSLVGRNQSAFIKCRSIHDNFMAVQQTCKAIHQWRTPCLLLKVDIAKAFDTVAWPFLLDVLQHMGFGLRWRNWVSLVLSSASTKILLNGP